MVYFIHGTAKNVIIDLNRTSLLMKPEKDRRSIVGDITRTLFLGTRSELNVHLKRWQDETIPNHLFYWQGDMSAGNIQMLFPDSAFKRADEPKELLSEAYFKQKKTASFAYVDKAGIPSGFGFCYRADDPSLWLIAITKNTHLPVEQREVYVLTSFNPEPYLVESGKRKVSVSSQTLFPISGTIKTHINSPRMESIACSLVTNFNKFNVQADILMLCAQYVTSESDRFEDNETLLNLLEEKPERIINNALLQKLNTVGSHLSPRQVIDCLTPESALHKVLLPLVDKQGMTPDVRERAYVILRLDRLGLLKQYEWITDDDSLLDFIKSLLNEFDDRLIAHFTTEKQVAFFRFLNRSPYKMEMARLLITQKKKPTPVVWKAVEFFHDAFLKQDDDYIQAVVFRLLLINPELTPQELLGLIKALTPSKFLAQVFNPVVLADDLGKYPFNQQLERIRAMQSYFATVLPKFEQAQALRKKSLQSDFLKSLGKRYTDGQDLNVLAICENEEQIKACQVLLELEFSTEILAFTVHNEALVAAINHLDALNLKSAIRPLLGMPLFHVILPTLFKCPFLHQRALLIFIAQKLIKIEEMDELRQRLVEEPYLASLIIALHEQKHSPSEILNISADPVKSRALHLLMTLKLSVEPSALESPIGYLVSLLYSACEHALYKEEVKDYLIDVLPGLLKNQFPAPVDKPAMIAQLSQIICDYQQVVTVAASLAINLDWLDLLKKKPRLQAMAVALREFDVDAREPGKKPRLTPLLFTEFASYFITLHDKPEDDSIRHAALALTITHSEDQSSQVTHHLPALMTKPQLAPAVLAVHGRNLPVLPLFQEDNQASRVALVTHLAKLDCRKAQHYQLAMDTSEQGYDFRKIMDNVKCFPEVLQQDATQFVVDAIIQRQRGGFFKQGQKNLLAEEKNRNYGNALAMRVLLVNRFRQLGLGNHLIDLLLEESEKGRHFFNLVTQVETRFQTIRRRLLSHAPDKQARYLEPERQYRTQLYKMIYDALCHEPRPDKDAFLQRLKHAEAPLMAIANEDRHPLLRKTLMMVTNLLTLIFTVGIANAYHYRQCGDFLFFERPATSEGINALDIELAKTIGAPAA
ncbi:hypothetical protein [Legionella erythra]|uniref:Uncharacterized protein n=1 Tax=Legionella erythra TaxID=448 RepID=A0A0W0TGD9_LEGER|nr:hypothetical protein [Legionella erythra]KTC94608.1 hypothetical protein Lery_2775 [Legionella erythra]